jgi:putative endonuclease
MRVLDGNEAPILGTILRAPVLARRRFMIKRFVYILNSDSDPTRYYTGIAGNVRRRLAEHNAGGCRHTSRWRPWRVVVVIAFASEARALDFERYLKSGSGCAFAARHFR